MIPTITIGVPSSHCFVRVHDDRATNSGEMTVDAVTLVTNIPAIVTEVKCTNVAIARGLVCTRCMSCKGYMLDFEESPLTDSIFPYIIRS